MNRQRLEGVLAATLLGAAVCFVPAVVSAADVFEGRKIYERNCAVCHGQSGKGEAPGTPDFTRDSRALMRPDAAIFDIISSGRGGMPAFRGLLEEREILDVVAYMRTFMGRR